MASPASVVCGAVASSASVVCSGQRVLRCPLCCVLFDSDESDDECDGVDVCDE